MIKNTTIEDFLQFKGKIPLADVRTPAEFVHGHIPGAFNLPLFSNDERVLVGTTYKQVGREQAILLGFDLTGSKWSGFIRQALEIAPDKKIGVHCWRGGMRSGAMAWALDLYGFEVYLIEGGYKNYRRWVHRQFENQYQLWILGGSTGSGKTRMLHELRKLGEQVIDLEHLAQHQGSSFGTMNKLVQPTQEQFENNLADDLKEIDTERRLWMEDESMSVGKILIPSSLWQQMKTAQLIEAKVSLEQRIGDLVKEYGVLDKDFLVACTERIHKRLGPLQTKQAVAAILDNRMEDFIRHVLVYYDKTYQTCMNNRNAEQIFPYTLTGGNVPENALQILNFTNTIAVTSQV